MRSVHDTVLHVEKELLKMKSPTYSVHVVKVPKGMGFVDINPAEVFFIRFDDIFNVFHLRRLHHTVVRLVALSLAHQIIREETPGVAIMDPFYMLESVMRSLGDRVIAKKQIEEFLVANKHKEIILMPYFRE